MTREQIFHIYRTVYPKFDDETIYGQMNFQADYPGIWQWALRRYYEQTGINHMGIFGTIKYWIIRLMFNHKDAIGWQYALGNTREF